MIAETMSNGISDRTATVGIIGLGYVGLPLAVEVARSGYRTLGFDVSDEVVAGVNRGESHIQDVSSEVVGAFVGEGLLAATTDMKRLAECDAISICVPTPLNKIKDPDLSFVVAATHAVLAGLRRGQIVILESTTFPGTTREHLVPLSLAWVDERLVIAVPPSSRTAGDIAASGRARMAVGPTRDVTMIDARLERAVDVVEAGPLADAYAAPADWAPRDSDGYRFLVLRPVRVQAWRESDELAGRTLMADGEWLV
jgi:3-hydroxyisobutyrate dehydrogenase-like beta-hydroxyacid dehydrogenase